MLRILLKTASSMGKSDGSVSAERYDEADLSTWEFVNASQSDDEDLYSFDGDDVISDSDGVISPDESAQEGYKDIRAAREFISIQPMSVSPTMTLPVEMTFNNHVYHGDDDVHDVDDEGDDDGDYDDELLPWNLKGRFGKQRIVKLGKRGPKPNKSKRMPMHRPGCLYGKQGIGAAHNFI
ncbi:hypothetical protein CASFOL_036192 [Castilleja foliolosa]|uniref:Uncharacterized protein n=1 Tax=Castilleja foliolosa TaxID=1961234 RepID=A0ABD3BX76_9LAMI